MGLARERAGSGKAWSAQLLLRGAGLVLLVVASLGGRWLVGRFGQHAVLGGGDSLVLAVACVVYAAASAGLMLTTLGPALVRHYPVPARYCRHRPVRKSTRISGNAGFIGGFFG